MTNDPCLQFQPSVFIPSPYRTGVAAVDKASSQRSWPMGIRLRRLGRAKEEDGIFVKNLSFLLLR